ncbi:MAG: HYR domain-containing protein [Marinilabiliales bacterium]|nr:HYR domain-containing protein [Marinilabiliales bacterium]
MTVIDNEAPEITCPSDIDVNNDPGSCNAMVDVPDPVYSDNCNAILSWIMTGATTDAGNDVIGTHVFGLGLTTVTYTVADEAVPPHIVTCSFGVEVTDNEIPTFTTCIEIEVESTDAGVCSTVLNLPDVEPVDNCSVSLTWALTGVTTGSGTGEIGSAQFNLGLTTVTYTATDGSGNENTCSFTITILDVQDPVITCPGSSIHCATSVNNPTYTAVGSEFDPVGYGDNCSVASVTNNLNGTSTLAGQAFTVGTTTVTWTIVDGSGNSAQCNFTVTVHARPTAVVTGTTAICFGQSTNVTFTLTGSQPWTLTYTDGTTPVTVTGITLSPYVAIVSPASTRTYTAVSLTDANCTAIGTDLTGSAVITVNPLPAPSITGPLTVCANSAGNVYSTANITGHSYLWNATGGNITGGQGTNSVTVTWGSGASGTITVTEYIAATLCSAPDTKTVTINPLPAPVITGPASVVINTTTAYSTPLVAGYAYTWSVIGGSLQTGQGTNSITVLWPGSPGAGVITRDDPEYRDRMCWYICTVQRYHHFRRV